MIEDLFPGLKYVPYGSCTTSSNGRLGSRLSVLILIDYLDDLNRDLSNLSDLSYVWKVCTPRVYQVGSPKRGMAHSVAEGVSSAYLVPGTIP